MKMADTSRKEIYTYQAPWTAYSMSWCPRTDDMSRFKIAIGSYKEEYSNRLSVIQLQSMQSNKGDGEVVRSFVKLCEVEHPYPATKVMWGPLLLESAVGGTGQTGSNADRHLVATTGDYLRIWSVTDGECEMKSVLNNNKHTEYCAPLTSFDWNEEEPSIIGTCSIDTTCTIW